MDHLNRLIARLHTPFDIEPQAVAVFRLSSGWSLRNHQLFIGADQFLASGKTIHELVNELEVRDYSVEPVRADLFQLDAGILMDGSGHAGQPISAFTSLLWAVKSAAGAAYKVAQDSIDAALSQLLLPQSTEEWADLFGQMFGIPREMGEPDGVYTARIIEEVKRARSNPFAISANIRRITGYDVEVREPWKEIFKLSESPMDEDFHFQGAPIWQYHTAQLVARSAVKWPRILREAEADRPAGTLYLGQATHYPAESVDCTGHDLFFFREQTRSQSASWWKDSVLSENLDLSNYFIIFNHLFVQYQLISYTADADISLASWLPPGTVAKGEICLSDRPELGDLQGHLPGTQWTEGGQALSLSGDDKLSDYLHRQYLIPIDEWFESSRSASVALPVAQPYLASAVGTGEAVLVDLSPQTRWSGEWDDRTWWTVVGSAQTQIE